MIPRTLSNRLKALPDLFSCLQGFVNEQRGGPLVLTGSQRFLLSEKISQILAGRAAILELLPLSTAELCKCKALTPETFLEPAHPVPKLKALTNISVCPMTLAGCLSTGALRNMGAGATMFDPGGDHARGRR